MTIIRGELHCILPRLHRDTLRTEGARVLHAIHREKVVAQFQVERLYVEHAIRIRRNQAVIVAVVIIRVVRRHHATAAYGAFAGGGERSCVVTDGGSSGMREHKGSQQGRYKHL